MTNLIAPFILRAKTLKRVYFTFLFFFAATSLFAQPTFQTEQKQIEQSIKGKVRQDVLQSFYGSKTQDQSILERVKSGASQALLYDDVILPEEYIVGPGDNFLLHIYGSVPLELTASVGPDGRLAIPSIGSLTAAGKNLAALREEVYARTKKQYRNQDIEFSLLTPRSFLVMVTGAIKSPGKFPINATERIDKLIAQAITVQGDKLEEDPTLFRLYPDRPFEMTPSLRNILIIRKDGTRDTVDLIGYYLTGKKDLNPYLKEGDQVIIQNLNSDFYPKIGIYGAIQVPGLFEYRFGDRLSTLIKMAQGFMPNADQSEIQIIRRGSNGFYSILVNYDMISKGIESDPILLADDRIQVKEKKLPFLLGNVTLKGEVIFPGYYPIEHQRSTLREVLSLAGGVKPSALLNAAKVYRRPKTENPGSKIPEALLDPDFDKARILRTGRLDLDELANFNYEYSARRNFVSVNFNALLQNAQSPDVTLEDGDLIIIPRDEKNVYVFGQVVSPGFLTYRENLKVRDYIQLAGGETEQSTGDWKILKAGSYEWLNPNETVIESGDWIFVPKKVSKTLSQTFADIAPFLSFITSVGTLLLLFIQLSR